MTFLYSPTLQSTFAAFGQQQLELSNMPNALEQLKQFSTIVADTGDFHLIEKYQPTDATTNPTLVFNASQKPEYKYLMAESIKKGCHLLVMNDLKHEQNENASHQKRNQMSWSIAL